MGILSGLSGTKKKSIPCEFFRSASRALAILRKGIAATAANDNGSLNVWRDDERKYRCEAHRHYESLGLEIFNTQKEVAHWIKTWLPKIA